MQCAYREDEDEERKKKPQLAKDKSRETQSTITTMLRSKCIKRGETRNKHRSYVMDSLFTQNSVLLFCASVAVEPERQLEPV